MPSLHSITSTDLKNRTADILNTVHYKDHTYTIKRHGKPIATLEPILKKRIKTKELNDLKSVIDNSFGRIPDFPKITRYFRRRNIKL